MKLQTNFIGGLRNWATRKPREAAIAGFFLLALLWILYVPTWSQIQKLQRRQSDLRAEMESAAAVMNQSRSGRALISLDQSPEVLAQLEELARQRGLRFLQVSPGQVSSGGDSTQPLFLPVDLQVEGSYRALGEFLGHLRDPGTLPAPALVRQLQISREEKLLPRLMARISLEIAFARGKNVSSE